MALDNFKEVLEKADTGDSNAMFSVAQDIIWGDMATELEPELLEKALGYYNQLAQDGDCDALLDLGAMYLDGRGVEKNEARALAYYKAAADQLYPKAFRCLGNYWYLYSSQAPDYRLALDAFVKGALCGEQNSLYMLGDMYQGGEHVEKDDHFAFRLYETAEAAIERNDLGYPDNDVTWDDCYSDVQLRLGECFLDGIGTDADIDRAVECLQESVRIFKRRIGDGDDPGGFNARYMLRAQQKLVEALRRRDEARSLA